MQSLDNNTQAFLALVRAGLWGSVNPDIRIDGTTDWEKVYQLAQEQSVQGLVLQGIEWLKSHNLNDNSHDGAKSLLKVNLNIPQVLLLQWIGEVRMIEQRNKAMNVFISELIEKLRSADIYALLVKGQGVAQCYERPLWRSCGDVDFFLSEDNYKKAKSFLTPLAESVDSENDNHLGMTIGPWVVEIHANFHCGLSARIDKEIDDVQNNVICGGNVRSWLNRNTLVFLPGVDNDVIFIFTHFLKHFYKGGLGMRQVCDWCRLLWTYRDLLNRDLLESRIRKMGLMSEWNTFGVLAIEYLGFPKDSMPLLTVNDDLNANVKRKAKQIMKFVLMSGNMGHNRDMSYFKKYPYLIRKIFSMSRRIGDLLNHARIFPLDSLRFLPYMVFNGMRSAMRGE